MTHHLGTSHVFVEYNPGTGIIWSARKFNCLIGEHGRCMGLRNCCICILVLIVFIAAADAREWTDVSGHYKVEGEFIELKSGRVRLQTPEKVLEISLDKLSPADQEFARKAAVVAIDNSARRSKVEQPPAKSASAAANSFETIAKDIEKSVVALGYPKDAAGDLVRLVRPWNCEKWKEKLIQARAASPAGRTDEAARVDEEVVKAIYERLGKEISPAAADSQYYFLPYAVRDKKAQCVGNSQLFYVLGNSLGLNVSGIDVLAPLNSPRLSHVACLVTLSDGRVMIVDLGREILTKPFDFKETFVDSGEYWDRGPKYASPEIFQRIQILDANGLGGCVYHNTALTLSKSGRHDRAISSLTKAIELNPKFAEAYSSRGVEYSRLGRNTEAMRDYNSAIELNPKYASAFFNRGLTYRELGKLTEAMSDYTKAVEIDPRISDAYYERGWLYNRQGKQSEAIREFSKCIELDEKNANAYWSRGSAHQAASQHAEALRDFNRAIEVNPMSVEAYCTRGSFYGELGKQTEAIADFSKAIEMDPKYALAYFNRGVANAHLGKSDRARKDLQKAAELDPAMQRNVKHTSDRFKLSL